MTAVPPTWTHPQKPVSSPSPMPSLNDLLGLADDARALDKLGGDYGLDIGTKCAGSSTNAMRFLRELKDSHPEILQQNERLIIAAGNEDDLRGRQLYPQKDVSWTWSHSQSRNPKSPIPPEHYSISQGQRPWTSYDRPEPKSNSQSFSGKELPREEFGNRMARSGPIAPSFTTAKTNIYPGAVATGTYYEGSSSMSPISFSSASTDFSLPPGSNENNPPHILSYVEGYPRTCDHYESEDWPENQRGLRGEEYGNSDRLAQSRSGHPPLPSPITGDAFPSGEPHPPRSSYSVMAHPHPDMLTTRMHPHTLIHDQPTHVHGVKGTFAPAPGQTTNPYDSGYEQESYEYPRYASGGRRVISAQQPQLPLAAPVPVPALVSDPHAHVHESASSRFLPDWASMSARELRPPQPEPVAPVATSSAYAHSYHDHTHPQWR